MNKFQKKHTFFAVIKTKPVGIMFQKITDKIKQVSQIYIITSSYQCNNEMEKIKDCLPLSLTNRFTTVAVAANSGF